MTTNKSLTFYAASAFGDRERTHRLMQYLASRGWVNSFDWTTKEAQSPFAGFGKTMTLEEQYAIIAQQELHAVDSSSVLFWYPSKDSRGAYCEVGAALVQAIPVIAFVEQLPEWHMIFFHHPQLYFVQIGAGELLPEGMKEVVESCARGRTIYNEGSPAVDLTALLRWVIPNAIPKKALPRPSDVTKVSDNVVAPSVSGPKVHALKTLNPFFSDVLEGRKNFEVRKNDRDFKVGDVLCLQETTTTQEIPSLYMTGFGCLNQVPGITVLPQTKTVYTGREMYKKITYILEGGAFGLSAGFVVLGLEPIDPVKFAQPEAEV